MVEVGMNSRDTEPSNDLLEHLLVPVAHAQDATRTARTISRYEPRHVTVTHVVEKGEGVADKTPVEQSENVAAEAFAVFREWVPDAKEELTYRRDVVAGIVELADEIGASAIGFCPRESDRIRRFLAGDKTLRLVTEADRPVIAFPTEDGG